MGTLVPPIKTYGIEREKIEPIIPIINIVDVGDSFKLDAFKTGFLGEKDQMLISEGVDQTPVWVDTQENWYTNKFKSGVQAVPIGKSTITFPSAFTDDLYTVSGNVRVDTESTDVFITDQTKYGFTFYTPIAGALWWTALKHNA